MSNLNMSVGSTIKERRESLSMKQDDLANKVGVTVQTMSKWERDLTEPKASQVYKLSKALKISEHDICKGESMQKEAMDPFEFVRKVSILIQEVPHTELLVGMQEFIDDEEGFLRMLAKISNHPFELFEVEAKEQSAMMLRLIENAEFDNEEEKNKILSELSKVK
ncbi:MAG: helix-turn-helix transcriptional regulator [Flavobacteriaceae bacterium]|nr:helix-turn-helix transcriptional regulator [Flavobacteriaceae bacterium]MBL4569525.1 helix-turn-helix transcriptional regulator [Flavobacteriaceae bacterium]